LPVGLQVSFAHSVPTGQAWQPPFPSHLPFVPQLDWGISVQTFRGSTVPAAIGEHFPSRAPGSAQLRQAPVQAWSQQILSTQWLCWHSLEFSQLWPSCLGPQVLVVPLGTQAMPTSQSAFVSQIVVQAPFAQRNGLQFWTPGGLQVPSPLHVPAVFRRLPEQVGALQIVSRAYFWQPPTASHSPFWPHVDAPWSVQILRVSTASASSGQQVPSRPIRLQLRHGPLQATLQQTPSAQKPEAQSSGFWQAAPFMRGPQLPLTHWWPLTHWLLVVQVS
jgi:hypothetical protein